MQLIHFPLQFVDHSQQDDGCACLPGIALKNCLLSHPHLKCSWAEAKERFHVP